MKICRKLQYRDSYIIPNPTLEKVFLSRCYNVNMAKSCFFTLLESTIIKLDASVASTCWVELLENFWTEIFRKGKQWNKCFGYGLLLTKVDNMWFTRPCFEGFSINRFVTVHSLSLLTNSSSPKVSTLQDPSRKARTKSNRSMDWCDQCHIGCSAPT